MEKIKAILQYKGNISDKQRKEIERNFENEVIILPEDFKIIGIKEDTYKILTKEMFKLYIINRSNNPITKNKIEFLNKEWEKVSKGYNFIILVGENNFYGVEEFNKVLAQLK